MAATSPTAQTIWLVIVQAVYNTQPSAMSNDLVWLLTRVSLSRHSSGYALISRFIGQLLLPSEARC